MIWSIFQAGLRHRILGIVNERSYLDALTAAEAKFGEYYCDELRKFVKRTLTVEPGITQKELLS